MWYHFVTLPLVARIIGLLSVASLAAYGWLKRKAIAASSAALVNAASDRFWGYLRRKVQPDAKSVPAAPTNARTYKGIFQGYNQYQNYPHERYFTLSHDGITTKVPVMQTNLLSGVQHEALIEIDTLTGFSSDAEVVQRVRVLEEPGRNQKR
jgi:hypothetical protein